MSIRGVVLRGFGNGTFTGTIGEVVTRGYSISTFIGITGTIAAILDDDTSKAFGIVGEFTPGRIFRLTHPDRLFRLTHPQREFKV